MRWSPKRLRTVWVLATLGVSVASLAPPDKLPLSPEAWKRDKLLHFSAYTGLAAIPAGYEAARVLLFMQPGLVVLGVALEFAQRLTVDREFEWADVAANTAGVAAGCLGGLAIRRRLR